jgi:hypothetical protein
MVAMGTAEILGKKKEKGSLLGLDNVKKGLCGQTCTFLFQYFSALK